MNYKRKSRRRFFLLMRSRTPPISSEFRGGFEHPKPPLPVRHWSKSNREMFYKLSMGRERERESERGREGERNPLAVQNNTGIFNIVLTTGALFMVSVGMADATGCSGRCRISIHNTT